MIHTYVLSLITGSDIVQWLMKNLDIEDQGMFLIRCIQFYLLVEEQSQQNLIW